MTNQKNAAMPAEHARELAIVAMLLAAAVAAEALDARELGASLGGAAVALIIPRVPTSARVGVVATFVAGSMLAGCGAPVPARSACRAAASLVALACESVPETVGGEASP